MEDSNAGLERSLNVGDYVILSTGAIATARQAYPKGYCGIIEMLLDGNEVADEASSLTLPERNASVAESAPAEVAFEEIDRGETRGPTVRMKD